MNKFIVQILDMNKNQKIGTGLIIGGIAVVYYGLFLDNAFGFGKPEKPEYTEYTPAPILLNDDRKVFQGSPSDPTDVIRGYDLPADMNKLSPINGQIAIGTKPNVNAFGEGGRSAFNVTVDFLNKKLSFKPNVGGIKSEPYETVRTKLVITDKKYLKA
jgi:hypothetical protein